MWIDYLTVIRNTRLPLDYSLRSIPLLLLPLIAWLGGPDRPPLRVRRRIIGLAGLHRPERLTPAPASQG